jgi:hypothetical protein
MSSTPGNERSLDSSSLFSRRNRSASFTRAGRSDQEASLTATTMPEALHFIPVRSRRKDWLPLTIGGGRHQRRRREKLRHVELRSRCSEHALMESAGGGATTCKRSVVATAPSMHTSTRHSPGWNSRHNGRGTKPRTAVRATGPRTVRAPTACRGSRTCLCAARCRAGRRGRTARRHKRHRTPTAPCPYRTRSLPTRARSPSLRGPPRPSSFGDATREVGFFRGRPSF